MAFAAVVTASDLPFTEHNIDTDLVTAKTIDIADVDGDVQLGTVELLFEQSVGDPLMTVG